MTSSIQLITPRGNTLCVTASGAGPGVMLLHGFPLDSRMWHHQMSALETRYQVLAVDLRGFGDSSLEASQIDMADLAADVEFVRQSLLGNQTIVLVGLSMGGYVAFEYWRNNSQHLAGLVLSNTKPQSDTDEARLGRLHMADEALRSGAWPAVAPMLSKLISPATSANNPAVVEFVEQMMRATGADTVAAAQRAMANRRDFTAELHRIRTPTLVITGEHDQISPPESNRSWSSQIGECELQIVAGAGHLPPLETPSDFNAILSNFLETIALL